MSPIHLQFVYKYVVWQCLFSGVRMTFKIHQSESVRLNTLMNLRIRAWFRHLRPATRPISGCLTLLHGPWMFASSWNIPKRWISSHKSQCIAGCLQVMKKLGQSQDLMGMGFLDCSAKRCDKVMSTQLVAASWCPAGPCRKGVLRSPQDKAGTILIAS